MATACEQAGLVKLGHVALDGTKIRANASKHKAMSHGRMKQWEAELCVGSRDRGGRRRIALSGGYAREQNSKPKRRQDSGVDPSDHGEGPHLAKRAMR